MQSQYQSGGEAEPSGFPLVDVFAISELSLTARAQMRKAAQDAALNRAINLRVITAPEQAVVHMIYPDDDLNAGAVAYNQWLTQALVAAAELAWINIAVAQNQVISIYGFFENTPTPAVVQIRLAKGPAGRNTLATYNIQRLRTKLEGPEGYFSKVDVYDRTEVCWVGLLPNLAAAAGEEFGLLGYTVEPVSGQVAGAIL